jgi:hypothetical protein
MAIQTAMKRILTGIDESIDAYAREKGWKQDDYQAFLRVNEDWGQFHIILVARAFPVELTPEDQWIEVIEFLQRQLKKKKIDLGGGLHLVLRTFDEVAEGGLYAIGPGYEDIRDPFLTGQASK